MSDFKNTGNDVKIKGLFDVANNDVDPEMTFGQTISS